MPSIERLGPGAPKRAKLATAAKERDSGHWEQQRRPKLAAAPVKRRGDGMGRQGRRCGDEEGLHTHPVQTRTLANPA